MTGTLTSAPAYNVALEVGTSSSASSRDPHETTLTASTSGEDARQVAGALSASSLADGQLARPPGGNVEPPRMSEAEARRTRDRSPRRARSHKGRFLHCPWR